VITPEHMVGAIRRDLADRVLPAVTDDRARSSVIAAMGILGDLALQIREDESWAPEAVALLEAGIRRWRPQLGPDPAEQVAPPPGPDPGQRRRDLLGAIESLVERLWAEGGHDELLRDIRGVLRADLAHQLKRIR